MVMHDDVVQLARTVASLWNECDSSSSHVPRDYERLMWAMGGLIRGITDAQSAPEADQTVHELIAYLGDLRAWPFSFSELAEMVLLNRVYPDGPPWLRWQHLGFLVRVGDDRLRRLYESETIYRGWSEIELHRQIEARLFAGFHEPDPLWRFSASGTVLAATPTPEGLAILRSTGLQPGDSSQDRYTAIHETRVDIVNQRGGIDSDSSIVPAGEFDALLGFAGGTIYRSSINSLLRRDSGEWRVIIQADDWAPSFPPVEIAGAIVTVWNHNKEPQFRICVLDHDQSRWSDPVDGLATWVVATGGAVTIRIGGLPTTEHRLARFELGGLRQTASARVKGHALCIAHGDQFLSIDRLDLRVAEDMVRYVAPAAKPREDEWRVTMLTELGESLRDAVSCFETTGLTFKRQWIIAEEPRALQTLPEGRGLLITCKHSIEAIVPNHARPIKLARWKGAVVGDPVRVGTKVLWLVHRDGNEYAYSYHGHGTSLEEETNYLIEALDYATGSWSFLPLSPCQPVHSMHLCGETVVLIGTSEVLAFDAAQLVNATVVDPTRQIDGLAPFPEAREMISGLPLSGPMDQRWAAELSPELAEKLLPEDDLIKWNLARDGNERFRNWQRRVAADLAQVNRWPDFTALAAAQCPQEFLALTALVEVENESSPSFESLAVEWSTIEPVLAWKHDLESRASTREPSEDAVRRARRLLYEHAMQCASARTLDEIKRKWGKAGITLVNALPDGVRDAVAWLNLARVRPNPPIRVMAAVFLVEDFLKKPAIALSLAWGASMLLLGDAMPPKLTNIVGVAALGSIALIAAAFLTSLGYYRVSRNRRGLQAIERLQRDWPDGCPSLIEDADAFVRFVQQCQGGELLDWHGRTELQLAVAKAWEHPVVTKGDMVFVSYSHKQEVLARQLVNDLRALGVGAVLDRNELELTASHAVVETWIAEGLMRAVTAVYLVSDDIRSSGWVHRESEWQLRVLGTKPSLVLPYVVLVGDHLPAVRYPRSRTIDGDALTKRPAETARQLAGRVVLDWLLSLKSQGSDKKFGIAYQGKGPVYEIVDPPKLSTLGLN